jgi:hypothetical protein
MSIGFKWPNPSTIRRYCTSKLPNRAGCSLEAQRRISPALHSISFATRRQWSEKVQSVMPGKDKERHREQGTTVPLQSQRTRTPNSSCDERRFVPLVHRLCALDLDANPRRCVQNLSLRVQTPHRETEKYRYPEYVLVPGCRVAPIETRPTLLDYLSLRHSQVWTPDGYWKQ